MMITADVEQSSRVCSHPGGCPLPATRSGWCPAHGQRVRRTGDPGLVEVPARGPRRTGCSVDECARPHDGHGLCSMHLRRWHRDGDVHTGRPTGDRHFAWAGDRPSYSGAHQRVARMRGPAIEWSCAFCACPAAQWAYTNDDPDELIHVENTTGKAMPYSADPDRYIPLCAPCHVRLDQGRHGRGRA